MNDDIECSKCEWPWPKPKGVVQVKDKCSECGEETSIGVDVSAEYYAGKVAELEEDNMRLRDELAIARAQLEKERAK